MQSIDESCEVVLRRFGIGFGKTDELESDRVFSGFEKLVDIDDKGVGIIGAPEFLLEADIVHGDVAGIVRTDEQLAPYNGFP